MFRKIVIGGLIAALSGGLIYGGIYRTAARAETGEAAREGTNRGEGRNAGQNENQGFDQENDRGFQNTQANSGNKGNSGYGQRGGEGVEAESGVYQTVESTGIVSDITKDWLAIRLEDGSEMLIEDRAWWYALDSGFSAIAGDSVQVTGFIDDDGKFEPSMILNMSSGVQVEIRGEQGGRPNWAGGGGGGGNRGGIS